MDYSFKVAGLDYKIVSKPQEEMNGTIGQADFNQQEVRIGKGYSKQTQKIAVYHEIIHILSDAFGLNLTEQQVKIGTHALLAFLAENPGFDLQKVLDGLE